MLVYNTLQMYKTYKEHINEIFLETSYLNRVKPVKTMQAESDTIAILCGAY